MIKKIYLHYEENYFIAVKNDHVLMCFYEKLFSRFYNDNDANNIQSI